MNPLGRLLTDTFGSARYAVLPLIVGYALGIILVAACLAEAFQATWSVALLGGVLLGGLAAAVCPAIWAASWVTHRALASLRTSQKRRADLEQRLQALEAAAPSASSPSAGLKYSADSSHDTSD